MWKIIVAFFNTPVKRYYWDGEEMVDPSPRISMIWSILIILGGSIFIIFLLIVIFAFIAK
jgi:hypothetical protein